jgi:leucyl aminopeptidase
MKVLSPICVLSRSFFPVWLSLAGGLAWAKPISVIRGGETFAPLNPARILFQDRDTMVVREPTAEDRDFRDLYVVNLANHFSVPSDIEEMGEVLDFVPRRFAVMRLEEPNTDMVAARLHGEGMACGLLTKLNGDEMSLVAGRTPTPRIPVVNRDDRAATLVAKVATVGIKQTIDQLAAIPTRFHRTSTGETVADVLAERYQALAAGRQDVTVATYDHKTETSQRSLIVRIEGRTKPEEVIVLGSHLDSVNWSDGSDKRAPGADDNASGTATNVEVFRVLMAEGLRPERSVEIHAYAAEEIGLVGSQDIAQAYRRAGRQVVAMVQHDMTLYKKPGTPDKIWLVSNNTDDALNNQLGVLIDTYVGMAWAKRPLYAGSSDHASWKRAGFPAAFPFENPSDHNPHIHTANDTTERANAFDQAAGFGKLAMAFIVHFAGVAE